MIETGVPAVPPLAEPAGLRESFGRVLRVGVVVSGLLLAIGLGLEVVRETTGIAGRTGALPLGSLVTDLATGQPWAFLWLGVVALAATPMVRVALALGVFARAQDRAFVAITGFVLAVLLASIVVGITAG